uniref:Uncharacterized protein n=1 Tax=Anguilla anguilla TaxID=7936 RepID=A0A0E9XW40_ANGAN
MFETALLITNCGSNGWPCSFPKASLSHFVSAWMEGSRLFLPTPKFFNVMTANLLCCFHAYPLEKTKPLLWKTSSNNGIEGRSAKFSPC